MKRVLAIAAGLLVAGLVVFGAGPSGAATQQQTTPAPGHDEMTTAKAALRR